MRNWNFLKKMSIIHIAFCKLTLASVCHNPVHCHWFYFEKGGEI